MASVSGMITLKTDPKLHSRIKMLAVSRNAKLAAEVEKALQQYCDREEKKEAKKCKKSN